MSGTTTTPYSDYSVETIWKSSQRIAGLCRNALTASAITESRNVHMANGYLQWLKEKELTIHNPVRWSLPFGYFCFPFRFSRIFIDCPDFSTNWEAESCKSIDITFEMTHTHTHTHRYIYKYIYTYRVSRGNVPDFGRMFLTLKYTDITQNTYVYPKLSGYGDNGERSLKVWQLLHTYWLTNTY